MSLPDAANLAPMSSTLSETIEALYVGDLLKYQRLLGKLSNDDLARLINLLKNK
jgi:hypothetical protein